MSITADIIRGHTETIILANLMEHDSYGYQINKDILRKTDNRYELKEATLYTAFRRLEQAGPCVIIGRCSDFIVQDGFHVFICGSMKRRVERMQQLKQENGRRPRR